MKSPGAKTKKPGPTWRITVLRKKGESLGTVEAANADEAIEMAIKLFGITDWSRKRFRHDDQRYRTEWCAGGAAGG
jgi:hypothetical protein